MPCGRPGHRLAVRAAAGPIDGFDGDGLQTELLRGFGDVGAAAALVFDLVVQILKLRACALRRDLALDDLREALEARVAPGSILVTFSKAVTERPFTGSLTVSGASEKAASAIAGSPIAALVTVPRSMSDGVSLRSFAMSSNDVPAAIFSRAAFASSMFGNAIW